MDAIITAITGVWQEMTDYLVSAIGSVSQLFYVADTGLTFVGALAVLGLGFSVATYLIATVRSYLQMRAG